MSATICGACKEAFPTPDHECPTEPHSLYSDALRDQELMEAYEELLAVCEQIMEDHEDPQFALERLPSAVEKVRHINFLRSRR